MVDSGRRRTEMKNTKKADPTVRVAAALESSQLAQAVYSLYSTLLNALFRPLPTAKKKIDGLHNHSVKPARARAAHGPRPSRAPNVRSVRDYPKRHQRTGAHPPSW